MRKTVFILAVAALAATPALAGPRDDIVAGFAAAAVAADPSFGSFSAQRGEAFFLAKPASGKPETPSCTTCHTADPHAVGHTRAGKEIQPMAVSATPDRFTDPKKVAKWFRRNCRSVLGRECTASEKGNFLTYMIQR